MAIRIARTNGHARVCVIIFATLQPPGGTGWYTCGNGRCRRTILLLLLLLLYSSLYLCYYCRRRRRRLIRMTLHGRFE